MMKIPEFDYFIAVDWSGAKGKYQSGLKVACAENGNFAPFLFSPPNNKNWSRPEVVHWLNEFGKSNLILVGFDFSFSGPFLDKGAYFPGANFVGDTVKKQWEAVEILSKQDKFLGVNSLITHEKLKEYFLKPNSKGKMFERRFRVTERVCKEKGFGRAESMFHLIGPSQVGLGSYSGMKALLRLKNFSIWPFDEIGNNSVVVEIFTRLFINEAGAGSKKIRNMECLNTALENLKSKGINHETDLDDHSTDALIAAAGLRYLNKKANVWSPEGLSDRVKITEGWTFGVR